MRKMFLTAEDLKAQTLHELIVFQDTQPERKSLNVWQRIASSQSYFAFTIATIMFSLCWLAVEVEVNEPGSGSSPSLFFAIVQHLQCFYFLFDIVVVFKGASQQRSFLETLVTKQELVLDCILVLLFVLDTWVWPIVSWQLGTAFTAGDKGKFIFVAFRLLRVARLLRVVRLLHELSVLHVMIRGIIRGLVHALRAIAMVSGLILLIVYVTGLGLRIIMEGSKIGEARFSSVAQAMGTLLLECTLSGNRGIGVIRDALDESLFFAILLILFVMIANVTMMGVMTGLLVQTVRTVAEAERDESLMRDVLYHLEEIWARANDHDNDGDGHLDGVELSACFDDINFRKALQAAGFDLDCMEDMFPFLLKHNGDEGRLSKETFMKTILEMRTNSSATHKDHVITRRFVQYCLAESVATMVSHIPRQPNGNVRQLKRRTTFPRMEGRQPLAEEFPSIEQKDPWEGNKPASPPTPSTQTQARTETLQ